jgi:hypothetical protein
MVQEAEEGRGELKREKIFIAGRCRRWITGRGRWWRGFEGTGEICDAVADEGGEEAVVGCGAGDFDDCVET